MLEGSGEMPRILLVDDEQSMREMTRMMLSRDDYAVTVADSGEDAVEALETAEEETFDLVLTDLKMKGLSGLEVLDAVKRFDPSTQVVMMTAYATPETAVEAMKRGAYDYIEKPFKRESLLVLLSKALEKRRLLQENFLLREELAGRSGFGDMVGRSEAMVRLYEMLQRIAPTNTTVLVTGESGTGKELAARALHDRSPRNDASFVPVNCGAIPESLIESELFGHVKGAFTGAHRDKKGLFRAAEGGTVFLDEVGELPAATQVKLLRVLQERRVQPVGSTTRHDVDVRVVAATNRDLREEIRERRFREDLFYRLAVIEVQMPALRERTEDIPLLVEHFLHRYCEQQGKRIDGVTPEAMEVLVNYPWPGNVRELENVVERAVTLETDNLVSTDVLPYPMMQEESLMRLASDMDLPDEGLDLEAMVEKLERSLLTKALKRTGGNRTDAAKLLGISFRSIRYRLDKYDIDDI